MLARASATAALGLTVAAVATAVAAPGDMTFISRSPSAAGDAASYQPSISGDGRVAAFASVATNFVAGTSFGVYVKDLQTGTLELVSRADGAGGAPATTVAHAPSLSSDGRYVAFLTTSALDPADTDGTTVDVYVRDRVTHDTVLASVDSDETPLIGPMSKPALSADGRHVAFEDGNLGTIVVRHLADGTTETASLRPNGETATSSQHPSISADGTRVAFYSGDNALSDLDGDGLTDVFVRDLAADTTILVSRTDDEAAINGHSSEAEMSADGRRVVFRTGGTNLPTGNMLQLYERDLDAGTTTLVSRADGAAGAAANDMPAASGQRFAISADGRRVVWTTKATNLSAADTDAGEDVYVRDVVSGSTWLASRAAGDGPRGDAASSDADISADGGRVVLSSKAGNFSAEDADGIMDVFLRELPPVPGPPPPPPPPPETPAPPPAPPITVPSVTPPPAKAVPRVRATDIVKLPSTRKCVSRRRLRITIRRPAGVTVREVRVVVGKRKAVVVRGSKLKAPVDLRGLPRGTFRVKVTVKLGDGRTLTISRTYRTCRPKR